MTIGRRTALIMVLLLSTAYILLTLLLFNSPAHLLFNKEGDLENWASLIIGSGIAVYIAMSLFVYSHYEEERRNTSINKRNQFAMKMIGKNLIAQASLLAGLQRMKGKNNNAINMITGEKMNMEEFNEKGLQLNNMELKSLLNISFDVIDADLMDRLMDISGKIDFIDRFKQEMAERGEWLILTLIKQAVENHFPELMTDFQNTGASTSETHDFKKSHKS